jgi:hypothetical protein
MSSSSHNNPTAAAATAIQATVRNPSGSGPRTVAICKLKYFNEVHL